LSLVAFGSGATVWGVITVAENYAQFDS